MASGTLLTRLMAVRHASEALIEPLDTEDLNLQGMADASPPKWHLAHTTWFFETFVLRPHQPGYEPADARWSYLFNSYYEAVGPRQPRPQRGLLSRPPMREVSQWRTRVNEALERLLESSDDAPWLDLVELGLQHEQQHQELMLMDLLDGFSRQPLEPAYRTDWQEPASSGSDGDHPSWLACAGGLVEVGHAGSSFHFDNETPRHRVWLDPFQIADRLVTNGDYLQFINAGGYQRPELWMSEGWAECCQRGWRAPRYWRGDAADEGPWLWEFTLGGRCPLAEHRPVRHLSWFEADAYARWAGARLPSEAEWELASRTQGEQLQQSHGELWQWTSSPYRPYPGFQAASGAVGEYNGKFMTSQFVLRGSSQLTPKGHSRDTYRNFFPPVSRWMAAGLRLAR
ncbi:MAG: ergothioneine biosynthesis protein EgtB [Synechococcus sp. BS307-5m-G39]|nr:ergothioneine biosynthesis protein EgtB [Synechococcus sp. BS307-5m-G39]